MTLWQINGVLDTSIVGQNNVLTAIRNNIALFPRFSLTQIGGGPKWSFLVVLDDTIAAENNLLQSFYTNIAIFTNVNVQQVP